MTPILKPPTPLSTDEDGSPLPAEEQEVSASKKKRLKKKAAKERLRRRSSLEEQEIVGEVSANLGAMEDKSTAEVSREQKSVSFSPEVGVAFIPHDPTAPLEKKVFRRIHDETDDREATARTTETASQHKRGEQGSDDDNDYHMTEHIDVTETLDVEEIRVIDEQQGFSNDSESVLHQYRQQWNLLVRTADEQEGSGMSDEEVEGWNAGVFAGLRKLVSQIRMLKNGGSQ